MEPRFGVLFLSVAKAVSGNARVVRAAALEAIAKGGNPILLTDILPATSDKKTSFAIRRPPQSCDSAASPRKAPRRAERADNVAHRFKGEAVPGRGTTGRTVHCHQHSFAH